MKYLFLLIVTAIISFTGSAQVTTIPVDFIKTDITKGDDFNAFAVTVFGAKLGMSKAAAIAALKHNKNIVWKFDSFNTPSQDVNSKTEMRVYISAKDTVTGLSGDEILYFIWDKGSTGLDRIVFFKDMQSMAVGDTKKLFGTAAVTPGDDFYKRFLVKYDKETAGSYTIEDNYNAKHLQVIQLKHSDKPNDIYFSLDRTLR